MQPSGVSARWTSRWCLQSAPHLLPVLTHPSGGEFPACHRAAADRRYFGEPRLPLSTVPTWGPQRSAAKATQRCQRGWRRSRSWQAGGRGGLQSWVGCMPSAGRGRPGFTIILSDNHFHNLSRPRSGGLRRSRYVRCVRAPHNPDRDPPSPVLPTPPAIWKTSSLLGNLDLPRDKWFV